MSVSVGYTGLTGSELSWGGSGNALININQLDPKYQAMGGNFTLEQVPNPFFGVEGAGQFRTQPTIARGQLLRPYPQFGDIQMLQSTGARSQYHAGIIQIRKRTSGLWGGNFSYTYSRLTDNQFGEGNYYSSAPGLQNNYTVVPDSPYYNPDQEYGRSLLDSPHKIVISPILQLSFASNATGFLDAIANDWQVTPVVTFSSGFPMGVSQNQSGTPYLMGGTLRPNVVPGVDFMTEGDITDRIKADTTDNLYLNKAAFAATASNQFGNAPRTLPGVYSPWRNNMDLSVSKSFNTGKGTKLYARMEVLNLLNLVQWASPASSAFGNSSFGQITNQANNMRLIQFTARFQF
jgi:hypothetical protein